MGFPTLGHSRYNSSILNQNSGRIPRRNPRKTSTNTKARRTRDKNKGNKQKLDLHPHQKKKSETLTTKRMILDRRVSLYFEIPNPQETLKIAKIRVP